MNKSLKYIAVGACFLLPLVLFLGLLSLSTRDESGRFITGISANDSLLPQTVSNDSELMQNYKLHALYEEISSSPADIEILTPVLHPHAGEQWVVEFRTSGSADLTIELADEATINDMEFASLSCGLDIKEPLVKEDHTFIYRNWKCDEVGFFRLNVLKTGSHHLIFYFGDIIAHANNAAKVWDGGGDGISWSDDSNWSPDGAPGVDDDVTIDADVTVNIGATTTINSLTLGNVSGTTSPTLNFSYDSISSGALIIDDGNLTVNTNSTVTHSDGTDVVVGKVFIDVQTGDADIDGSFNVDAKGYRYDEGPGQGLEQAGGGGYGGEGGDADPYVGFNEGGPAYGSLTSPTDYGSGGGQVCLIMFGCSGRDGGGAIRLDVAGTTTVDGSLSADGSSTGGGSCVGGGAGGSVYLNTDTLAGTGEISADGGDGSGCVTVASGGGGGGRIAVYYTTDSSSLAITSYGGLGFESDYHDHIYAWYGYGGAGTIFTKAAAQANGELLIDNNDQKHELVNNDLYYGKTPLSGTHTFDTLTVQNYGDLKLENTADVTVTSFEWSTKGMITDNGGTFAPLSGGGALTIPSSAYLYANTARTFSSVTVDGILTHSNNDTSQDYQIDITTTGNFTVSASGAVSADERGFSGAYGPGAGSDEGSFGSGAGHGGVGGSTSDPGSEGGPTYGSETVPVTIGSGGGRGAGADDPADPPSGGGAIQLTVGGDLAINGRISANPYMYKVCVETAGGGVSCAQDNSEYGGSSGGSVYLDVTGEISGEGSVQALGGGVDSGNYDDSGGGAGGRVAFSYGSTTFTGDVLVDGFNNLYPGEDGTIYPTVVPAMSTQTTTDITTTSATANGSLDELGMYSTTEHGHVWAAYENPRLLTPLAHFKMNDDADNSTVVEETGNFTGTYHGTGGSDDYTSAHSISGKINTGIEFNEDDYVQLTGNFNDFSDGFTLATWVYPTGDGTIFEAEAPVDRLNILDFRMSIIGNDLYCYFGSGQLDTQKIGIVFDNSIVTGSWQHIACTHDAAGTARLYINGEMVKQKNVTHGLGITDRPAATIASSYDGYLDDFRIYDIGLTTDEIGLIYNLGVGTETFDVMQNKSELGPRSSTGSFTSPLASLDPGTLYYVRSYAFTDALKPSYGVQDSFYTLVLSGNNPPLASIPGSITQDSDASGYIYFTTTVSDVDDDDTQLKVEYSDDNGVSWYDAYLAFAVPDSETVDLNNSAIYQVGSSDTIDSSIEPITLTLAWNTKSALNGNGSLGGTYQSDILVRVIPNDTQIDGAPKSSPPFTVDNVSDATTASNQTWVSNSTVYDIVVQDDTLFMGGSFDYVGRYTGMATSVTAGDTASLATTFQAEVGGTETKDARGAVSDGNGGWYLSGRFLRAGGRTVTNLVHILPNGMTDPYWTNLYPDNRVNEIGMSPDNSTLYVGGDFTTIGGENRRNIAAIDVETGTVTSWDPNASEDVDKLVVAPDGTIYVAGSFTSIGGQSRYRLAALDPDTGLATSWNPDPSSSISEMELSPDGSTLFVTGYFSSIGGESRQYVAAVDTATGLATDFTMTIDTSLDTFAVSPDGSTLYFGGWFDEVDGESRDFVAAYDLDTNTLTDWSPVVNDQPNDIIVSSDGETVYMVGWFDAINGEQRGYAGAVDATTGITTTGWYPRMGVGRPDLMRLSEDGTEIFIAGDFNSLCGYQRKNFAAINVATNQIIDWDPNLDCTVYDIEVTEDGSTMYASGCFSRFDARAVDRMAKVDIATLTVDDWDPDINSTIRTAKCGDDSCSSIYAGGYFSTVGGQSRTRLAEIETEYPAPCTVATTLLTESFEGATFPPTDWETGGDVNWVQTADDASDGAKSTVSSPLTNDQETYLKKTVTLSSPGEVKFDWKVSSEEWYDYMVFCVDNDACTIDSGYEVYTTGVTDWVEQKIKLDAGTHSLVWKYGKDSDDYYYVGDDNGRLDNVEVIEYAGTPCGIDTAVTSWNPTADSTVYTVEPDPSNNRVYVGGSFLNSGGQPRNRLAAIDMTTGNATSWDPNAGSYVYSIEMNDAETELYVGGSFTTMNGATTRNRLASFDTSTGNLTSWDPNASSSVVKLQFSPNGTVLYAGGGFTTIAGESRERIAIFNESSKDLMDWLPIGANGYVYGIGFYEPSNLIFLGGTFTGMANEFFTAMSQFGYVDLTALGGNNPPSVTNPTNISQSNDDPGLVTFNTTVSDIDSDDTRLKVDYSDDGGQTWYDAVLIEAESSAGTIDYANSQEYQIGSSDAIDTSGESVTLTITWDTLSGGNGNGSLRNTQGLSIDSEAELSEVISDLRLRVTANDFTVDSTPAISDVFELSFGGGSTPPGDSDEDGDDESVDDDEEDADAGITIEFSADVYTIEEGGTVVLCWETDGLDYVHIVPEIGYVGPVGCTEVNIEETTVYTLWAQRTNGTWVSKSITIVVEDEISEDLEDLPVTGECPVIREFYFEPEEIKYGDSSDIVWAVDNADAVTIDELGGRVTFNGRATITPDSSAEYILIAEKDGCERTETAAIKVFGTVGGVSTLSYYWLYYIFAFIVGLVSLIKLLGFSLLDIPFYAQQARLWVLYTLGMKTKGDPWGIVYDSVSKERLSRCVVRLYQKENLIDTTVTDANGIFNFETRSGVYTIEVSRSGYFFPSELIVGNTDGVRKNVYNGGEYEVKDQKGIIRMYVPMDRIELSGLIGTLTRSTSKGLELLALLSPVLLGAGAVLAGYYWVRDRDSIHLLIGFGYLVMIGTYAWAWLKERGRWGRVVNTDMEPVNGLEVGLYDPTYNKIVDTRVSDDLGRFRFVVPGGEYILKPSDPSYAIAEKGFEAGYVVGEVTDQNQQITERIIVRRY